jgi:hypothetical protein
MAEGLTSPLVFAALVTVMLCFLVAVRDLPPVVALVLATIRSGSALVYFAWLYNPRWTFLDDVSYWHQGRTMLASGYGPVEALFSADGLTRYFILAQGVHFLYIWWCHLAQSLFGPHYYAPVFLNITVTFVAGAALYRLARRGGLGEGYARGLLVFFLLHWDLLIWSSMINLKDLLVLALTIVGILSYSGIVDRGATRRRRIAGWVGLVLVMLILPWIRFYLPVLLLLSFAAWAVLRAGGWQKLGIAALALLGVAYVVTRYTIPAGYVTLSPVAIIGGSVRFLLTPQPWSIESAYSFLTVPAIMHWLLVAPATFGAVMLWRSSPVGVLAILFLLVNTAFYAAVPELQGPRQRIQVSFVILWAQFHAVYVTLSYLLERRSRWWVQRGTERGPGRAVAGVAS